MADINVTEEIIDINVTEEVINIEAPAGAYPLTGYVPYIGALDDVDLGTHDLKTNKVFLLDESNNNYGSIHYSDGDFHIEDADGHKLLVIEDGFMQLHLTDTIQSNLFTTLLTQTRDHYLPNASGTLALTSQIPTNPVGGTGTTNTLPKFTAASTIGNSNITDTGTLVTIASPLTLSGAVTGVGNLSNYTVTATAGSAISKRISSTLIASANSDVLVGLDITPTFTLGAFTGTQSLGIRSTALITTNLAGGIYGGFVANSNRLGVNNSSFSSHSPSSGVANQIYSGSRPATPTTNGISHYIATDNQVFWDTTNAPYNFLISGTQYLKLFNTSGNFTLQNGGTFTDAGFRLDVNGTTRFIGTASSDTAPLGSELAAVTGTGTNWTLAGTNLNVGGYTHATGSVVALTTALAAVSGTYYQIAYTITGRTAGSITIDYGGTSTSGITATGATGPLASSTAVLTITPTTDFNGTVVLSIKSIGTSVASSTIVNSVGNFPLEIRASSAQGNTFIGLSAGSRNTSAQFNTAYGAFALQNNTTGQFNTAISRNTLQNNTTGQQNTAIGHQSLQSNTIGISNAALGSNALQFNTTGNTNTACGRDSLGNNTTGSQNVGIGSSAGRFITGGSTANTISNQSIYIGQDTKALADNQTNQIVIGYNTTGLGTNTTIIGTTATTLTALYGSLTLGTTTDTATALLSMSSTTKGFLPPVMTTTQKNAISSPATGLVVFDTTLGKLCVFATTWQTITSV